MLYTPIPDGFMPWQPSTWPEPPQAYIAEFSVTLERIFRETILDEISNVISDATVVNDGLSHRGHVVLLALMCAVDSMAAYAFNNITGNGCQGTRYENFIATYFPVEYRAHAKNIYELYRNSSVHSWNLFQVGILPGNESITSDNGRALSFGLLNFNDALAEATESLLTDLSTNPILQTNCIQRYTALKNSAV